MKALLTLWLMNFAFGQISTKIPDDCIIQDKISLYLEMASEMIEKAKDNYQPCSKDTPKAIDCGDLLRKGHKESSTYTIWPKNRVLDGKSIDVYCDMDTDGGGWTVIQRRGNFSRPKDFFFQDWSSYKKGFGNIDEDFWLGNDNIFALSNQRLYSIRFDLKDVEGNKRYAMYDTFWIDSEESNYTLHIKDYSGDAGDSMATHHGQKFSTKDRDNDISANHSCALGYKGGWWYSACHAANLNGLYLRGKHDSFANGVNWKTWKGHHESLDTTEIKIRHRHFRKHNTDQKHNKDQNHNTDIKHNTDNVNITPQ